MAAFLNWKAPSETNLKILVGNKLPHVKGHQIERRFVLNSSCERKLSTDPPHIPTLPCIVPVRLPGGVASFVLLSILNTEPLAKVVMTRSKSEELSKTAGKQSPFTFRRIQSRELYQPANDADGQGRLRFRVKVQILGRGANQ
jgi:hypothetical protein